MRRRHWVISGVLFLATAAASLTLLGAGQPHNHEKEKVKAPEEPARGRAPESLPAIPRPDAGAAQVPPGYHVEVVLADLTYPTSVEFDDTGTMYVAEGGFVYGDDVARARVLRFPAQRSAETVADNLNGPVTDLLWHDKRLYISHRGKISVLENGAVRDLVTGLPSLGDHHNNQLAVGPDGKIYFGQGTATNSGVVGLDSFKMGWLAKYPDVSDVPAKDIRLHPQPFETPDVLALLSGKGHSQPMKGMDGMEGMKDMKTKGQEKGKEHEGHDKAKEPAKGKDAEKGKEPVKGKEHDGHDPKGKEAEKGKEPAKGMDGMKGMEGMTKGHEMSMPVKSYAFQPFGKTPPDDGAVRGTIKASGTILRMNPDGSDLEVYAWGLRNPFGVMWGPDGKLYASDNGYDERGSRPIAHAPDLLWVVKKDAWYGFPDYAGGIPVTDSRFQPEKGPAPKFLMRDHPPVEKPFATLTHHVGAAKIDFGRGTDFGFPGHLFLALSGDMNPITGMHAERSGFEVVRIDPATGKVEPFFKAKKEFLGPKGMEYVTTAGPRRPVDVRFSPDGKALYVVDVGSVAVLSTATGPAPRPFPGSGVVWRVTRSEVAGR